MWLSSLNPEISQMLPNVSVSFIIFCVGNRMDPLILPKDVTKRKINYDAQLL